MALWLRYDAGVRTISSTDTICAIVTPPGPGGLGVVRLSGPNSLNILMNIWRGSAIALKPRRLYLGSVTGIDRAMAVFMPGPATYTGDDVVELSAHGSPVIMRAILEACCAHGARPAAPGEFTRRAFLAGKLDLAQAEGVADLIAATSERGARLAADQLAGRLSDEVRAAGDALAKLRARIEAAIDFPEEEIDLPGAGTMTEMLEDVRRPIDALRATFREGRLIREGIRVAICGKPNAGKSSLLNGLAGRDRAIVHHLPGTTRDVIEEAIAIGGVAFHLRDTAGLRADAGDVEALGIERTRTEIAAADLVLAVFDGAAPPSDDDEALIAALDPAKTIVAINKSDLPQKLDVLRLADRFNSAPLATSAKTRAGLDELAAALSLRANASTAAHGGAVVTSVRHKALLDDAIVALDDADAALSRHDPVEFVAHHLALAQDKLGSITGAVTTDDLLDRIFSQFCIGK